MIVNADGHVGGDLIEGLGDGVEAGDPVVVVLDGGEGELGGEVRIGDLDAGALGDGHLPFFEVRCLLVLGEAAQKQIAAGLFLLRQTFRSDGGQAHDEGLLTLEPKVEGLHGVVVDLVVVALVADGGGKLGIVLEAVFPVVAEDGVESFAVGLDRGC